MIITAKEARKIMSDVLNAYNMEELQNTVAESILRNAKMGKDKIYYVFEEHVPENARKMLCDWLCGLGYDAILPVADKTKIRISWR